MSAQGSGYPVISSRQNRFIQQFYKLSNSRSFRRAQRLMLCDGFTLLSEAPKDKLQTVLVAPGVTVPKLPDSVQVFQVDDRLMAVVSPVETPQGVVFTCQWPTPALPEAFASGRHLLLEGLQDPGNVGSILRSARAFGLSNLVLTKTCADPYAPKALRASMGAVWGVSLLEVEDAVAFLQTCPLRVLAAMPGTPALDVREVSWDNTITLLGNEGAGLSERLQQMAGTCVRIPMEEDSESLGVAVAAGILLWEMAR